MPATRARAFTLTVQNYTADSIKNLEDCEWIRYAIVGKEGKGKDKTPHLQCYIQTQSQLSCSNVLKRLKKAGVQGHLEIAQRDLLTNVKYCSKEGDVCSWGEAKTKGSRNDLKEIHAMIEDGACDRMVRDAYPGSWYRYHKSFTLHRKEIQQEAVLKEIKTAMEKVVLKEWQQKALDTLIAQDQRKILWVVDPVGNTGKTYMAKYLFAVHGAFKVTGGKTADIAYAYKMEGIVVFDFARQKEDFVNYSVIEDFKNGTLFSPKYESKTIWFKPAKVIVFSNWEPDQSQLSKDRWSFIRLNVKPWHVTCV